ncbi:4-hydroxybenzoate octaprenyltransferase [uncultured Abyssibacter sp.]|uniref:4-hydroxybenzoate octaprenyltransferase n=1 Tax=uncultured Abyssibacter sp. TaxID=2320202 RepID=UPI0032B2C0D2
MRFLRQKLVDYALLMRLDRPIGIWLLLWPTLWALWIAAGGPPDRDLLLIFVAGVVLMRSAGCMINDVSDHDIDPHVARTANRPIAAGRVRRAEGVVLFVLLALIALALVWQTNWLTILLAVPAAIIAASYPLAKRWHSMPQAHLGIAFSWGIPMAFAAQTGTVAWEAWPLFLANVLWTIAYDTFYAMADRDEDLAIGVQSSAILFGRFDRAITALLQLATLGVLFTLGQVLGYGLWFNGGLVVAALLALRQQWQIRHRDSAACFQAFLANHRFGAVIFIGLLLETWPQGPVL